MQPTLQNKLKQLRRKLTGWILVHGMSRWLMALLAILACDMLLDRIFKMDFAQRLIMLVVMAAACLVYFGWRVIRPLLQSTNDEALIYEIESKNPELNENLISGWQLNRQQDLEAMGVSPELAAATIRSGMAAAEKIDFTKSLDLPHYRQNAALLSVGLLLTVALAIGSTQTEFLKTWFNRNVLLGNAQWPQGTYLEIAGVQDNRLVIPRGADHRQLVLIRENSSVSSVNVTLEVDSPSGRTSHSMKSTGKLDGREQSHVFHNVSSTFRFRARGGDDVTEWVDVELVEPPAVIELDLVALLPTYTGTPRMEFTGTGPHSVIDGSSLQVRIETNKVLKNAFLKHGDESLPLAAAGKNRYSLSIPPKGLRGGEYEFALIDESGLANSRPSKFAIKIKEDLPPKSRASLLGISGLVVPRARLPVSYQVADEFGLQRLYFDCQWKTGGDGSEENITKEIVFVDLSNQAPPVRELKEYEVLDLLPLNLTPGISFRFSVAAVDTRPDQPGIGKSSEFLLRVVSDEELRADLLRREIEQRKSFEQAYETQMELASEIQAIAAKQPESAVTIEQYQAARESELIALVRNQKAIGTSVARVADRFEEFLVEVKNNRLDEAENELAPDKKIENRFDRGIIQPIRKLDSELISLATQNLDNCRRAVAVTQETDAEFTAAVDQTAVIHQQILVDMKRILDAMNDSENFQEVINDLLEIKGDSANLIKEIENQLKPNNFDDVEAGIFDE